MLNACSFLTLKASIQHYQDRGETSTVTAVKDQLQIIHSRTNHWIAASSVDCRNGGVNIYDSVYSSLDESTEIIVCDLFHTNTKNLKMQSLEKQVGGTDCGIFAIAAAIAYDKNPSELTKGNEETPF